MAKKSEGGVNMTFFANFKRSAAELKDLRCLCVTAILIALDLVLKSVTIPISADMKITFAFLALASIGMLFGPVVAFLAGTVTDILGMLIAQNMGAFNPMFTLVEATGAMIYGIFLYGLKFTRADSLGGKFTDKNDVKQLIRIVLAKVVVVIVCNLIMTPFAITITKTMEAGTYNAGVFWTGLWARITKGLIKNAIQCPVDCILLFAVLPIILTAYNRVFKRRIKAT